MNPEDLLHFIELREFSQDWEDLGLDVERDLWALQTAIMSGPERAPVIQGTGGVRKMRFAPERWQTGKSGAVRVCYAYFKKHWTVLLMVAYGKAHQETLTADEKEGLRAAYRAIEQWLNDLRS